MQAVMNDGFGMLAQFVPMAGEERPGLFESPEKSEVPAYRVLIMEGCVPLARLLATGLGAESLAVDVTHTLDSAMSQIRAGSHDLLLLDLDLPDMDGLKLLADLRMTRPSVRILALSGRAGTDSLVAALDQGADDYLPKPFSLLEMMARVRALRRRTHSGSNHAVPPRDKVVLNREQCQAQRDGRIIDLTPREFTLLEYLMQNAGKTLSRALLTKEVWNMPAETNTNIVDVYIKYLRDKLDGDHSVKLIRTIRGMGYLFQAHA
jgi:two-component system copper resistance phosphate regulon response regulator CusR